MKKLVIFFILLIIIPIVFADWFYNSENVIVNINISSEANIFATTPSGYIESASVNMTFFPKQTENQELLKLDTNPKAEITDNSLKFTWKRPIDKIDYSVNTVVKTTNSIKQIRNKIKFPIEELPEDIVVYTKPSETIDSNNEDIIRLASELVKGEDDLFVAVFKIADWTKNNINYNLSTLTAEISQKASWVLENKQGVCDELTSLFIAMLRAVGIPARFVSGISYTNSELFPENWGAHGWAEVYFTGYGWVPFDVTYGEFGWIDPTHIKFKDSVDSDEPSTYYQWTGRNADLLTSDLDIKTNLADKTGYYKIPLLIEASIFKKAVDFGSYNLLEATIENLNDFYYATELRLSKPKEIKVIDGDDTKSILLYPKEKKKIFWILKIDNNLDKKYSYTFPLVVSTLNNISSETSFVANIRENEVSLGEIQQLAKLMEEEKQKTYSINVLLNCRIDKEEFYEYEDAEVYCDIKNAGNVFLENLDVCFENQCKKLDIGISQTKNTTFEVEKAIGYREIPVTAKNELVSKADYISFKVKDAPKIEIEDLEFPVNVSYNDSFSVSFTLVKKSDSNPKNVKVVFAENSIKKSWSIKELNENNKFDVEFLAKRLKFGKNDFRIEVTYHDDLNKQYNANKEFSIYLTKVNLLQRIALPLNNLSQSTETIAVTLLAGFMVALGVIAWLFRKSRK